MPWSFACEDRLVLIACDRPLVDEFDLALLDLDGVVYVGPDAVPDAPEHLAAARAAGMQLAFVTNNAARPPAVVAEHLTRLGIPTDPGEVVTSAQAAARLLSEQIAPGSRVFVIGGDGLNEALRERGLEPVQEHDPTPAAVVSGYSPQLAWRTVTLGAILVRDGLPWVASNTDVSVPTPYGPGPGNGVIVKAVADFAGREPVVAGKPEPPLFRESVERVAGKRPLVVGDRLDTDIEGAHRAGLPSLLVLTGVTGLAEILAAPPHQRPAFISADLRGLHEPHPVPAEEGLGGWHAETRGDVVHVSGAGTGDDWWRVVADTAWRHHDTCGVPISAVTGDEPG
ncbi:MAG: HAD-IIA family hydrolase [Nocardioidaceae bacterium]